MPARTTAAAALDVLFFHVGRDLAPVEERVSVTDRTGWGAEGSLFDTLVQPAPYWRDLID